MRFAILQNEVVMQFDPRDLEDLIALSQAGSLSAAAKRRGVAISTISRRIEALETALKIKLVDRQARGSRLTRAGSEIAKAAEPLSAQLGRVNQLADAIRSDAAMMPVRLSATEFVISDILSPALGKLWSMGAGFPLHLQSQSDIVSLAGRDADLAVRMSRPEGASLFIRKLPTLHLGLFAAEGYLDGRHPARLDLGAEKLLIYDDSYGRLPELEWLNSLGLRAAVAMRTGSTRVACRSRRRQHASTAHTLADRPSRPAGPALHPAGAEMGGAIVRSAGSRLAGRAQIEIVAECQYANADDSPKDLG
jgi:DNA-binding transcriptional LysR family regulator